MKFHRNVPSQNREILTKQLMEYEKDMKMTSNERKELHEWVALGHSPYENGYNIYNEFGCPMDYVSAIRFEAQLQERCNSLSEEEIQKLFADSTAFDTESGEPIIISTRLSINDFDEDKELPFK